MPAPLKEKVSLLRRTVQVLSIAVFVSLTLFVISGLFLPNALDVKVTRDMKLPATTVYSRVSDLRQWPTWLPWHAEDPGMAMTYQGTPEGVGMVMSWDSQRHGEGRVTIAATEQDESVRTSVEFKRQGTCTADFRIEPVTQSSSVVSVRFLSEYGQNYAGRYIGWLSKGYVEKKLAECLEQLESTTVAAAAKEAERKRKTEALPKE